MFDITRSKFESDRTTDFVAIGNILDEKGYSCHAAFVIQYKDSLFEFHYTGKDVIYDNITNDYYHKITDTIPSFLVPSFIAFCLNVLKSASPQYGFFYSGEKYNKDGSHKSDSPLGETMTCVGFCLNVLKGFHDEDYIEYSEWVGESVQSKTYLERFCNTYNLDIKTIQFEHRRITPREVLVSCFFTELPIHKKEIETKMDEIDEWFSRVFMMSNN